MVGRPCGKCSIPGGRMTQGCIDSSKPRPSVRDTRGPRRRPPRPRTGRGISLPSSTRSCRSPGRNDGGVSVPPGRRGCRPCVGPPGVHRTVGSGRCTSTAHRIGAGTPGSGRWSRGAVRRRRSRGIRRRRIGPSFPLNISRPHCIRGPRTGVANGALPPTPNVQTGLIRQNPSTSRCTGPSAPSRGPASSRASMFRAG